MKVGPPEVDAAVLERHHEHDEVEPTLRDPGDERIDPLRMGPVQPREHEWIHHNRPATERDLNRRILRQQLFSWSDHPRDGERGAPRALAGNAAATVRRTSNPTVRTRSRPAAQIT